MNISNNIVALILRAGYVETERYASLVVSHTKGGFATPTQAVTNFLETVKEVCGCKYNNAFIDNLMQIYDGDADSIDYYDFYLPMQEAGWDIGVMPTDGLVAEISTFNYLGRGFNNNFGLEKATADKFDCSVYRIQHIKTEPILVPFIEFETETNEEKRAKVLNKLTDEEKRLLGVTNKE